MASEFLLAFRSVVQLAGNDPSDLAQRASEDPRLQRACDRLNDAATSLWISERYSPERFAESIPSHEIQARREFEQRWKRAVAETHWIERGSSVPARERATTGAREDHAIENAEENGLYYESRFDSIIEYMRTVADSPEIYDELSETAANGVRVWDDFRIRANFRLGAALARLELVPFTLIPSQVSRHHGSSEEFSMLQLLEDAQRAFVFGCYLSCAALQRSILEDVLHRNYQTAGRTLPDRINSAEAALPWGLKTGDLHQIARLANDVLHVDRREVIDVSELLKRLVDGLYALQKLIEGAPVAE